MEPTPARFLLQPPVFHPVLPYITTIFGGVYHGKLILVQGMVLSGAERFQVDFQSGCSVQPRADIAFHFNPRFSSSPHVICNTLEGGRWQDEKKTPKLPLRPGDNFQLLFCFERECVKVSVSGHHFLEYQHRLPLERVDTLSISGDVMVKAIGFLNSNPYAEERTEYPVCQPLLQRSQSLVSPAILPPASSPRCLRTDMDFKTMPYSCRLAEGLIPGQTITLRGLVSPSPEELTLTLTTDTAQVPLKLAACFREQEVLWNSFLGQAWEQEEKVQLPFFPFYPERFFEVLLLCEAEHFRVAINGVPLGEYSPPCLDLKRVSEFRVSGSVELYSVQC